MLHYGLCTWKANCYCSFTDVFIVVATNIHNKVSFNIKCFKNFLPFSSILFTVISGAPLTPLHLNISMHILHTVLCTFPNVLEH